MSRRCRSHATKRRYPSRPVAAQALARIRVPAGGRGPQRIYRCEHCGGWFLTSWDRPPTSGDAP